MTSIQPVKVKGIEGCYIIGEPIVIQNNNDFSDLCFNGDGTFNSPYRIENYNINKEGVSSISIMGTTDYFVIRNSTFSSIVMWNVQNGYIVNNTIKGNYDYYISPINGRRHSTGVDIGSDLYGKRERTVNIVILNNTIINHLNGIRAITETHGEIIDCIISSNSIKNNKNYGLIGINDAHILVRYNNFINNTKQAIYDGEDNPGLFEYNYWDDHTQPDENNNGIVDTPYEISYSLEYGTRTYDYHPLTEPNGEIEREVREQLPPLDTTFTPASPVPTIFTIGLLLIGITIIRLKLKPKLT